MTTVDPSDPGPAGATQAPAAPPAAETPSHGLPPPAASVPRRARRPYRSWVRRLLGQPVPGAVAQPAAPVAAPVRAARPRRDATTDAALRAAPFVLALLAATAGQYYFNSKQAFFWDGVTLYAIACVLFLVGVTAQTARSAAGQPAVRFDRDALRAWLRTHAWQALAGALGAGLMIIVGLRANGTPPPQNGYPLFFGWVMGILGLIGAFLPADVAARLRSMWTDVRAHLQPGSDAAWRWAALALAAVLVLAAMVRIAGLDTIPVNLSGDEGTQGIAARDFLARNGRPPVNTNMFVTGWYTVPTMAFFYNSLGLRVFGDTSIVGLRAPWALLGVLSVLCTFLLVRELWRNSWLALLAAFLLAVGHYHLHFSRLGSVQIADTLFIGLTLWLFVRGERTGSVINFVLAGMVLGASMYFYFGARVIGLVLGVYVLYKIAFTPGYWQKRRWAFVAMGVVAVLVAFPLLRHFQLYPENFTARFNQVGIVPSGWLEREVQITGKSETELWGEQWRKSLSAFNFWPDPTSWYGPGRPLLDSVTGILFVLGAALAVWRVRQPQYLLIAAWFLLSVYIGWVLTENPPSSMRVVVVAPAVAILAALAAWELGRVMRRLWPAGLVYVVPASLALIAVLNLNFYFREYTPSAVYGNANAEVATLLGRDLRARADPDLHVYFFAAPVMYFNFGSIPYLAPDVQGTDLEPQLGPQQFFDPASGRHALFVFLADRTQDEQYVIQTYPRGCPYEVYRHNGEQIAYYAYEWPCR